MRARWCSLAAVAGLALLVLAGCGTHGFAAPLAKPMTIALPASGASQSPGTATLTPMHATRFIAYYKGRQVPNTGAATPVLIRQGSCTGPAIAAVTDGASELLNAQGAGSVVASQPDPAGGVDVAVDPDTNLYVVVYDHPSDATAPVVACGNALSGRQQYFDLYEADRGSAGIALGTALMSPIVATRVNIALSQPATGVYQFALNQDSCGGASLLRGSVESGATSAQAVVFRPLDARRWWLSVTSTGGQPMCVPVEVVSK